MNGFQHFDQDLQRFYACLETQTALAKLYYSAATLTQQDHANIDEGDAQIEDLECSIQYYRDEMLSAQADLEFTATGVSHWWGRHISTHALWRNKIKTKKQLVGKINEYKGFLKSLNKKLNKDHDMDLLAVRDELLGDFNNLLYLFRLK